MIPDVYYYNSYSLYGTVITYEYIVKVSLDNLEVCSLLRVKVRHRVLRVCFLVLVRVRTATLRASLYRARDDGRRRDTAGFGRASGPYVTRTPSRDSRLGDATDLSDLLLAVPYRRTLARTSDHRTA